MNMTASSHMERNASRRDGSSSGLAAWWWDRLAGLLQRALPGRHQQRVILQEADDQLVIVAEGGKTGDPKQISLRQQPQAIASELRQHLKALRASQSVIVGRLSADHAIQRIVELPRAAEANPRAVLHHQIDRLTPWPANHCSFDVESLGYSEDGRSLRLRLTAASKPAVTTLHQKLTSWGLRPNAIDAEGLVSNGGHQINLLPHDLEAFQHPRRLLNTLGLLALLTGVGLLGFQAYLLYEQQERLDTIQARLEALEPQRIATRDVADQVIKLREQRSFLYNRKLQAPSSTLLLERLSALLPKDVWLEQMRVEGEKVYLVGNADRASDLIALIESSPSFTRAGFTASTRRDAKSGKERFQIEAGFDERMGSKP